MGASRRVVSATGATQADAPSRVSCTEPPVQASRDPVPLDSIGKPDPHLAVCRADAQGSVR